MGMPTLCCTRTKYDLSLILLNTTHLTFPPQVTIYPGKGQVEPKVYFGSGPTKKDAKFACGSVAWANIEVIKTHFFSEICLETPFLVFQGGLEPSDDATALAAASKAEAEAGGADMRPGTEEVPVLDPKVGFSVFSYVNCIPSWRNSCLIWNDSLENCLE